MLKKVFSTLTVTLALGFAATTANADTLADILTSDGDRFDTNQNDFDIVTEAVLATGLGGAAATLELTAFLPTDKAFRILVEDLYGLSIKDEEALFNAIVETLTVPVVEQVLLYHLVSGTFAAADVIALGEGFMVPTLLGPTFTIDFKGKAQIRLIDGAPDLRDPIVRQVNIFADNGVAHVIDRVLLPPMD
ncbi:MAG: fasciclin domain-containing protein [Gammaproteobacteria bacterium]|nr:fasciclin domain-containing protein [Gammaproteobacteria bacterium]